ncbi:hypothetical protein J6W34_04675 [bacterium]|nr:hypothetical protein [bacterium]
MKRIFLIFFFILCSMICCGENSYPPRYTNHNNVNTCKNLLQKYTLDELSAMISSGNFDDIYVGDYIDMVMTSNHGTEETPNYVTEKVRWLVAAINYYKNRCNTTITDNHIVLVAETCFYGFAKMNTTATTAGGFASSSMYLTTLPMYDTAITNAFGSNHVLEYEQILTVQTNTTAPSMAGSNFIGCSSNRANATGATNYPHKTKLCLMNEIQVIGTKSGSSSYLDIGMNNTQFPIFKQMPEKIYCRRITSTTRVNYWLSDVFSENLFGYINNNAVVSGRITTTSYAIRPYFLFK